MAQGKGMKNSRYTISRRKKGGRRRYNKRVKKKSGMQKTKWGIMRYNVHDFTRAATPTEISLTANPIGPQDGFRGLTLGPYTLSDVIEPLDFRSLYESYQILYIQHTFTWSATEHAGTQYTTGVTNPQAFASVPILFYRTDYDDLVSPATLADIQEHGNTKSLRLNPNRKYKINVRLGIQDLLSYVRNLDPTEPDLPVYNTKFKHRLLDTASPGDRVPHFGLKIGIQYPKDLPEDASWGKVMVETKYYLRMYGSR